MIRDVLLDVAKGVGILLVVFAHTHSGYASDLINYFHMPLFFVLSGCALTYSKSVGVRYNSLLKGLVLPYFIFSFLTFAYWFFIECKLRPIHDGKVIPGLYGIVGFKCQRFINIFTAIDSEDAFIYNVVLWFLPALFVCRLLYGWLSQYKRLQTFVVMVLALLGFGTIYVHWNLPWCIEIALVALPFILLGVKTYRYYIGHTDIKSSLAFVFIGYLMLFVIKDLFDVQISMYGHTLSGVWVYVTGAIGSVATISLCWLLMQTKLGMPLSYLGRNSLLIMCLHEPLKRIVIKVASIATGIDADILREQLLVSILITIVVVVLLLPVIYSTNRWFPWIVGKR